LTGYWLVVNQGALRWSGDGAHARFSLLLTIYSSLETSSLNSWCARFGRE
jgi:hypothetical protein